MQTHPVTFPPDRRNDPMRRAEARVFDELNASRLPGFAHYEWQRDHNSPQLDVALWLLNVGRFGLDIKGGQYFLKRGKWYLKTGDGTQKKACPLRKAWDATMSLHDELVDILDHEAFFIAVLVFPDMEPDQDIIDRAERSNVHVLWGTDGLVERLQQIAAAREVYNPPDAEDIESEVAAVTDEQVLYEPQVYAPARQDEVPLLPGIPPGAPMEVAAGHITIQHVDTLIVHAVPGETPGIDGLRPGRTWQGDSPCSMLVCSRPGAGYKPARPRHWPIMAPMDQPPPSGAASAGAAQVPCRFPPATLQDGRSAHGP